MKINVTKDNVTIQDKCLVKVHEGEYNVNQLEFVFSEEYTSDLVINAVFSVEEEKAYQMSVINNKCSIPAEVLENPGRVVFGVYAYKVIEEQLELRYSPYPDFFVVISGSYDPTAEEGQEITASQFEQYMQALQDGLNEVDETLKGIEEKGDYAKSQGDYAKEQAENVKNANEEATKIIDNFENNVQSYTTDFNNNAETKKTDFNNNYDQKLQSFNSNVSDQITSFNENATEKTNAFNSNSEEKISEFNENALQKTNDFNENASNKTNQFNQNVDKFYKAYHNQPTNQAEGSSISLNDSSDQDLTDFSVFGKSTQIQTQGNQLLNLSNGQVTSNGITTVCENGILKSTGTTTSSWFNLISNTQISLDPGQYTISIDEPISTNTIIFSLYGTSWQNITINKNMKSATFTIDESKTMVALRCDAGTSGTQIDRTLKVMLNSGNSPKDFEIYTEEKPSPRPDKPQSIINVTEKIDFEVSNENEQKTSTISLDKDFCSINDVFDEIQFQKDENDMLTNNYNFISKIKKLTLTGSENWQVLETSTEGKERYYITLDDAMTPSNDETIANLLSTHFLPKTATETYQTVEGISIDTEGRLIIYDSLIDNSIYGFKEWLASNNVVVQYEVKEAIITAGTGTVLQTLKNETHIINNKDCNMKIGYIQDTNTVIKKINDRISVLEKNELGG